LARNADAARMELIALTLLSSVNEPIGSLRLAEAFQEAGIAVAEATAGRYLRQLDTLGLTRPHNATKGRLLTEAGKQHLQELMARKRQDARGAEVVKAATTTELDELIDLLYVRRAVEVEAARMAATRGSDEEIARLCVFADLHVRDAGEGGETTEPSMHFHRMVAEASHNRMLIAVAALLLEPANDPLEKLLAHIALDAGTTLDQVTDHTKLAEALRDRDEAAVESIMRMHMDKLIREVEAYRDRATR
jgi:DNA-binding FadR family transcriptional regulator